LSISMKNRKPIGYWTYDRCLSEAKKYEFVEDFRSSFVRNIIYKKGWTKKIYKEAGLKRKNIQWTEEMIMKETAKYDHKVDWKNGSPKSYWIALYRGIVDKVSEHMVPKSNVMQRALYAFEYSDKSVYVGVTWNYELRYKQHMNTNKILISKKNLNQKFVRFNIWYSPEEAAKAEIGMIAEYKDNGWTVLNIRRGGELGGDRKIWTEDKIRKEAPKYTKRGDFYKNARGAYAAAKELCIFEDVCYHMPIKGRPILKWTAEAIALEAKKYETKSDFAKGNSSAYSLAHSRGLIDLVCKHMKYKGHRRDKK